MSFLRRFSGPPNVEQLRSKGDTQGLLNALNPEYPEATRRAAAQALKGSLYYEVRKRALKMARKPNTQEHWRFLCQMLAGDDEKELKLKMIAAHALALTGDPTGADLLAQAFVTLAPQFFLSPQMFRNMGGSTPGGTSIHIEFHSYGIGIKTDTRPGYISRSYDAFEIVIGGLLDAGPIVAEPLLRAARENDPHLRTGEWLNWMLIFVANLHPGTFNMPFQVGEIVEQYRHFADSLWKQGRQASHYRELWKVRQVTDDAVEMELVEAMYSVPLNGIHEPGYTRKLSSSGDYLKCFPGQKNTQQIFDEYTNWKITAKP
jgi:hypothetical protein